jgi:2-amino-4-hydroxy-6-hydroxymethyldihydropteridine diphosphokinase
MLERSFVMVPLAEIAPRLVLDGETAASRAASLGGTGIRRVGLLTELIS